MSSSSTTVPLDRDEEQDEDHGLPRRQHQATERGLGGGAGGGAPGRSHHLPDWRGVHGAGVQPPGLQLVPQRGGAQPDHQQPAGPAGGAGSQHGDPGRPAQRGQPPAAVSPWPAGHAPCRRYEIKQCGCLPWKHPAVSLVCVRGNERRRQNSVALPSARCHETIASFTHRQHPPGA